MSFVRLPSALPIPALLTCSCSPLGAAETRRASACVATGSSSGCSCDIRLLSFTPYAPPKDKCGLRPDMDSLNGPIQD